MKYTLKFISIHTRRTVSQVFFFYGDSVIKSCEGNQQGDLESPALFSDSIQDLIDSLESKTNLWYLDDGNSSDDYRTVLKDLKKLSIILGSPLGPKSQADLLEKKINELNKVNRIVEKLAAHYGFFML